MKRGLQIQLIYKAAHHVSRIDHPVHSNPHYHTWDLVLLLEGFIDAHQVQEWMHHTAPHFGDHGDRGVEDVAQWWLEQAQAKWSGHESGIRICGVRLMREDGIGAFIEVE